MNCCLKYYLMWTGDMIISLIAHELMVEEMTCGSLNAVLKMFVVFGFFSFFGGAVWLFGCFFSVFFFFSLARDFRWIDIY